MNETIESASYTLPVGTAVIVPVQEVPATITAIPGSGGTVSMQYTTSRPDYTSSTPFASAIWNNWPAGTVSVYTSDTLIGPVTAVKATAAIANGILEICQ